MKNLLSSIALSLALLITTASNLFATAGEEIYQIEQGFKLIPAIILLVLMAVYIGVGFLSRVSDTSGYWIARQGIGKYGNGAAIASDWMSAASFMGVAGLLYINGWFGLGYIIGWSGGYVLLLCLIAAQFRRFCIFTIRE
ncbi:MAG: cation acetate symporter, partial [Desulfuromonadaceae bacterium]